VDLQEHPEEHNNSKLHIQQYHRDPTSFSKLLLPQQLKERQGPVLSSKVLKILLH